MNDRTSWGQQGRHRRLVGHDVFTIEVPARGQECREPLLVLHGFPSSSFDFHLVVDSMAENRRVLLIDMIGYGLSSKPDRAYTMDLQADVVMAYTSELGVVLSVNTWEYWSGPGFTATWHNWLTMS